MDAGVHIPTGEDDRCLDEIAAVRQPASGVFVNLSGKLGLFPEGLVFLRRDGLIAAEPGAADGFGQFEVDPGRLLKFILRGKQKNGAQPAEQDGEEDGQSASSHTR